jgi:hypothetical protein
MARMGAGRVARLLVSLAALAPGARAAGQDLSPAEVQARWHSRLDARHFSARLRLEMKLHGMDETRELSVYRIDEPGGHERVLLSFERPPDLRDVRLLYREVPGRSNEYFLYTPSTRRVRQLPPLVAADDLYGVDLEFLGFGTAEVEPSEAVSVDLDVLDGQRVHRLAERALHENPRFDTRLTWLDPVSFIPLRQELRRRGELVLRARTLAVREIQGVPTPVEMSFVRPNQRHEVRLRFESVDYETPLGEDVFSILNLTRRRRELVEW